MSKIICDVCGTSYPETATQCPICGCVRPVDVVTVNNDADTKETQNKGSYTYVKGGRFSKTNVKKRNVTNNTTTNEDIQPDEQQEQKGKGDKGLVIAICILLLAIVAVSVYIAMHFFDIRLPQIIAGTPDTTVNTTQSTLQETEDSTLNTTEETIVLLPCEDVILSNTVVEFDKVGAANLINYTTVPAECSDIVSFTSSDETVATVDQNGKIEAVGPGQAVITIRCGEIEKECRVECKFEAESTEPSEEVTEPTVTEPQETTLKLNYNFTLPDNPNVGDVTITEKNSTWVIYVDAKNEIPSSQVTFTSSDLSVVTVDNRGVITAVGAGEAMITAEYKDQKVKCRVICRFPG